MISETDIVKNIKKISKNVSLKDVLIEFDELLENSGVYAYEHWFDGEIVEGPHVSTHWVELVLMYPHDCMPDPRGGLRLKKYNIIVKYKEGFHKYPVRVLGDEDIENEITRKAKHKKDKVWLVTIKMPSKYIESGIEDYVNIDIQDLEDTNRTKIDISGDM